MSSYITITRPGSNDWNADITVEVDGSYSPAQIGGLETEPLDARYEDIRAIVAEDAFSDEDGRVLAWKAGDAITLTSKEEEQANEILLEDFDANQFDPPETR